MRIVFMGTPEFAIPSLKILLEHAYSIAAVVTVPDKPAGRGQRVTESPVKQFALKHNLPVIQPDSPREPQFVEHMRSLSPELIVVVAFRILPPEIFRIPKYGSFNLHASLLPKYRGAAPINWAIIKGERETGVTTFFLEEKVDTGNIILQARVPIREDDTAGDIHDVLAEVGAEVVLHTVRLIETGKVHAQMQDNALASPAPKIFKEDCRIPWDQSAVIVHNFIRGLSPYPGAFTLHGEKVLKILKSKIVQGSASRTHGEIVRADDLLYVSTADGVIEVLELQQEGKSRLPAPEFLRGYRLTVGDRFS